MRQMCSVWCYEEQFAMAACHQHGLPCCVSHMLLLFLVVVYCRGVDWLAGVPACSFDEHGAVHS
jgi:hypothetical protein